MRLTAHIPAMCKDLYKLWICLAGYRVDNSSAAKYFLTKVAGWPSSCRVWYSSEAPQSCSIFYDSFRGCRAILTTALTYLSGLQSDIFKKTTLSVMTSTVHIIRALLKSADCKSPCQIIWELLCTRQKLPLWHAHLHLRWTSFVFPDSHYQGGSLFYGYLFFDTIYNLVFYKHVGNPAFLLHHALGFLCCGFGLYKHKVAIFGMLIQVGFWRTPATFSCAWTQKIQFHVFVMVSCLVFGRARYMSIFGKWCSHYSCRFCWSRQHPCCISWAAWSWSKLIMGVFSQLAVSQICSFLKAMFLYVMGMHYFLWDSLIMHLGDIGHIPQCKYKAWQLPVLVNRYTPKAKGMCILMTLLPLAPYRPTSL